MFKTHTYRTCLALLTALAMSAIGCSEEPEPLVDAPPIPPPNVDPLLGCNGICHGDTYSTAPPLDTKGNVNTEVQTVGAHRSHLNVAPVWYRAGQCTDCHVVPQNGNEPTHIDGDGIAEVTFGERATGYGQIQPQWNGATCTSYCHGATLTGGANNNPEWTQVNGTQSACGSCHGAPPPLPHAQDTNCGGCHTTMQPNSFIFLDPNSHINGVIDTAVDGQQGCDECHGGGGYANPPPDLEGNTTPDYPGVGAHAAHVGESDWHRQLYCAQCHVVPVNVDDPTHRDGDGQAELYFDNLNANAVYDFAAYTCSNLYCHGNGYNTYGTKTWNVPGALNCESCHTTNGDGQSGQHEDHYQRGIDCYECHTTVIDQNRNFIDPELHIDGLHEVYFYQGGVWDAAQKTCTVAQACHPNTRTWDNGNGNGNN